jgi:hypothetical protein
MMAMANVEMRALEEALLVDVAGVQPAVRERLRGRLGLARVPDRRWAL